MLEKKNSYDQWWLRKDMENMGYIFEYCNKYCRKLFGADIDRKKFLNEFMKSNLRYEMETGHQRLLSQSALDSIKMFIEVDCNNNIEQFRQNQGGGEYYRYHQLYWVGWMYAYLHFQEDILSKDLIKILPLDTMLEHYTLGHEIDKEIYYGHVKHLFSKS